MATLARTLVAAQTGMRALLRSLPRRAASTSIDVARLTVERTRAPKAHPDKNTLVFGATTTDHMLEVDWTQEKVRRGARARAAAPARALTPPSPRLLSQGWAAPTITPYHPLSLDPASSCLHYGIEAFEGMKAYRDAAGRVRLFRPEMNMARLARSMAALALPPLDERGFLGAIKALVALERAWIPEGDGFSLYLRPTVIGTQASLGVGPSRALKLFALCCPVGPYYPGGFKPVALLAESEAVRAWPGGAGDCKLGGNYAPTIRTQVAAAARGFAQVLWLVGADAAVTEVGTMNFFVLWRTRAGKVELVTAPLDGTILPGVTRDSMLALARGWGDFAVAERRFTMAELAEALREGRVLEAFGAGTAAVVAPVKALRYAGEDFAVPVDAALGAGPVAARLWRELLDIQYGRVEHEWSVVVE